LNTEKIIFKPRREKVKKIVSGRYLPGTKPSLWDSRVAGLDVIVTQSGESISLYSEGDQSTPKIGWEILLSEIEDSTTPSYRWTLYGVPKEEGSLS
jgi:hypothetical protein